LKKKILISFSIILLILIILYTYNDTAKYLMDDTVYFLKANDWYVSNRYSINIENSTKSGKDFAFWGQDKKTDKLNYVMCIYRKGVYVIDGSKGITIEEAYKVASQNNREPINISLVVIDLFRDDKYIIDYMYWVSEYENGDSKYIKFSEGYVVEDPFRLQ